MKKIWKCLYGLMASVQMLLIMGVILLNDLTDKKAGVLHHVYYRRHQYETTFMTDAKLQLYSLVAGSVAGIGLYILTQAFRKNKSVWFKGQATLLTVLAVGLVGVIQVPFFKTLIAYPYFVMAFAVVLGIQLVIVGISEIVMFKQK